jgi:Ankyrin repeats (many copies)
VAELDAGLRRLIAAVVAGEESAVATLLGATPDLAGARAEVGATRGRAQEFYYSEIKHYLYGGDTALHMAAAAHRPSIVRQLLGVGADVAVRNRRGAQPLHYAADGTPGSPTWNPAAQGETVSVLIEAGADPNATDKSGVGPLHRAVRTRCAAAVAALLAGGADPRRPNRSGSTPLQLAGWSTGRGGSGSPEAHAERVDIVRLLQLHGTAPSG